MYAYPWAKYEDRKIELALNGATVVGNKAVMNISIEQALHLQRQLGEILCAAVKDKLSGNA